MFVTNLILPGNALSGGVLACSCWPARPTAMSPQGPLESPWRPFFFQIRNRFLFICNPRYDRLWAREGNQISNDGSRCTRNIF